MKAGTNIAGKFLLEAPLASGGMGSVWRAKHVDLDVDVAVKLIASELGSNEQALARFKREARAAAQLRSPHVVQILDYGVFEGTPYIAMELLTGHDLESEIERRTRISLPRVKAIATQVGKALRVAHDAGIVHRDLKPANIFLTEQGGDEIVKLLDFGIAKESRAPGKITGGSTLLGSPLYMSPEQIAGDPIDARTDLWSFAIVLYEALVGAPPFQSHGIGALFSAISHGPTPTPSSRGVHVDGLDAFFERALEKDREKRFQSPKELVDALAKLDDDSYKVDPAPSIAPARHPVVASSRAVDADARTVSATELREGRASGPGRESNTLDIATSSTGRGTPMRADRDATTGGGPRRSWVFPIALVAFLGGGVALFFALRGPEPDRSPATGSQAVGPTHEVTAAREPTSSPSIVAARTSEPETSAPPPSSSAAPSASSAASVTSAKAPSTQAGTPLVSVPGVPVSAKPPKLPPAPSTDTEFGIPIPHGK